jgi:hypothetical protein
MLRGQNNVTGRAGDAAFASTFEVDVVLVREVEDGVAGVGFDGFEEGAFGVFEVDGYAAVWGMRRFFGRYEAA